MSTSSTSGNSDTLIPLPTLIDLIKSNARALYGRHLTYDVVTSMTKRPVNMPAPAKYDGQKVHALLIGYAGEADVQGKLLRGAFTVGVGKTPPTVGYAVKLLYDETRVDVDGVIGMF
jgi:hypothetical protein